MSKDTAEGTDGLDVDVAGMAAAHAAAESRAAALRDELKAARQRVTDATKALAALEKEAK